MTTVIGGSAPSITFSDSTTQSTAFTGLNQSASPYTTSLGYQALNSNTGTYNVGLGYQAGYSITTASNTVSVGYQSNYSNQNSNICVGVGYQANYSNTGGNPIAIGYQAGYYQSSGSYNIAIGHQSLYGVSAGTGTGSSNTAIGHAALYGNTTASNNTAVGYQAGYSNTTGYNNVMFGYLAGYGTITGYKNIFVSTGNSASITTGYQNIFIGNDPNNTIGALHDAINITTRGSSDKGSGTGYIDPNGGGVYQGNNSSTWSVTSDQRLKKNIVSNTVGLEKITGIQIRNFEYRLPEEVDPALKPTDAVNITGVQLGVIAQELQAVLPDCVKTESTGVMSVNSESVMWHLVTAVQQLNTLVTSQATEIAALKAKVGI